jgi:hypothetical protein
MRNPILAQDETRPPMSLFAADLFDGLQALNRMMLTRYPDAHLHWCPCGNGVTSTRAADQCPMCPTPYGWNCPCCEMEKAAR